jgi:murein L,D-transpeptidase YafK
MIPAALGAALALGGCKSDGMLAGRADKPIPERLLAQMEEKNMDKQSPLLVRLFKQEAELEVWKQDRGGRFELLKTYPICRWSGELGPKVREGDRQAPEGFYTITPAQMNPQSAYYLSFNMGYPNAFDKALGRTGSQLMIHGDCSSRGCYAMTDEQISEIYALGREAFFGGQRAFQVQAYPFRMTPANFAKHRANPHMAFWKMLKEGNDVFEVTRQEPKVDVCEKRYVFNAEQPANSSRPLSFRADAKCPNYQIAPDVAEAVRTKQRQDEVQTAQLVTRGVRLAPVRTGVDGGMHPIFASKLPNGQTAHVNNDANYSLASYLPAPGTIPDHVNPPQAPATPPTYAPVPAQSAPAAALPAAATPAAAAPAPRTAAPAIALRGPAPANAPAAVSAPASREADRAPAPQGRLAAKPDPRTTATTVSPPATASAFAPVRPANAAPAAKPEPSKPEAKSAAMISGSQPVVPSNSFESRWSGGQ